MEQGIPCSRRTPQLGGRDPLIRLIGSGKHIWADEHADEYVGETPGRKTFEQGILRRKSFHPVAGSFNLCDRHPVNARSALISAHPLPSGFQRVPPINPVVQHIEPELRLLLGFLAQLLSQLREFLRQAPFLPRFRQPFRSLRFLRSGIFIQAALPSSDSTGLCSGPFAPRSLPASPLL